MLAADAYGLFQVVRIEDIVVVRKNERVSRCLADSAQASSSEAKSVLSKQAGLRMPRKIGARAHCRRTRVVDDNQLPLISRESLTFNPA